jgi:hypothetical protein
VRAPAGKGGKGVRPGWKGRDVRVAGAVPLRGAAWHLVPTAVKDRYQMQAAPAGPRPLAPAEARAAAQAHVWDRLVLNAPAPPPAPRGSSSSGAGVAAAGSLGAGSGRASSLLPPVQSAARVRLIEKAYRHFWRRKGDIFHLLLNPAFALDDRVWPAVDKDLFLLLASLIHHSTGVRLRASFMAWDEPRGAEYWGRLGRTPPLRGRFERYGLSSRARRTRRGARGASAGRRTRACSTRA